jgi:hypothetical protein
MRDRAKVEAEIAEVAQKINQKTKWGAGLAALNEWLRDLKHELATISAAKKKALMTDHNDAQDAAWSARIAAMSARIADLEAEKAAAWAARILPFPWSKDSGGNLYGLTLGGLYVDGNDPADRANVEADHIATVMGLLTSDYATGQLITRENHEATVATAVNRALERVHGECQHRRKVYRSWDEMSVMWRQGADDVLFDMTKAIRAMKTEVSK